LKDFRCKKCQKLLGKYRDCVELEIKCPRCGSRNTLGPTEKKNNVGEKELYFAACSKS
jgi:phage FluMu protein Com